MSVVVILSRIHEYNAANRRIEQYFVDLIVVSVDVEHVVEWLVTVSNEPPRSMCWLSSLSGCELTVNNLVRPLAF